MNNTENLCKLQILQAVEYTLYQKYPQVRQGTCVDGNLLNGVVYYAAENNTERLTFDDIVNLIANNIERQTLAECDLSEQLSSPNSKLLKVVFPNKVYRYTLNGDVCRHNDMGVVNHFKIELVEVLPRVDNDYLYHYVYQKYSDWYEGLHCRCFNELFFQDRFEDYIKLLEDSFDLDLNVDYDTYDQITIDYYDYSNNRCRLVLQYCKIDGFHNNHYLVNTSIHNLTKEFE